MGFHWLVKESLDSTSLKRIRVKTDPSQTAGIEDFKHIQGYEGFILRECQGKLRVLILAPDMPIVDIPPEMLEHMYDEQQNDVFTGFKDYCKEYLIKEKNKKNNDPAFTNIDNSKDYGEVELFLKQNGVQEEDLNNLYRKFIENE